MGGCKFAEDWKDCKGALEDLWQTSVACAVPGGAVRYLSQRFKSENDDCVGWVIFQEVAWILADVLPPTRGQLKVASTSSHTQQHYPNAGTEHSRFSARAAQNHRV